MAGIYVIGKDGTPFRLGFALGNEFSDHVTERVNYLFLAHSKLRWCSFGPELRLGDLPGNVSGTSRIMRGGKTIWEKPFLSGEDNMSHTIANLEYHHFKYRLFRQPGDVHVHMFGTATLELCRRHQDRAGRRVRDLRERSSACRSPIRWRGTRPKRSRSGALMYGLIGRIRAVPGKRDELAAILIQDDGAMPGCLSYIVAEDPTDADLLWVTEVWTDQAAHRASLQLPAVQGRHRQRPPPDRGLRQPGRDERCSAASVLRG